MGMCYDMMFRSMKLIKKQINDIKIVYVYIFFDMIEWLSAVMIYQRSYSLGHGWRLLRL